MSRPLPAIHRLKDARAIDVLRDYVAHEDFYVAAVAGAALRAPGGKHVVELLVERVPELIGDSTERDAVALLLEVIHDADPGAAERLVAQRFRGDAQLMMRRTRLREIRDRAVHMGAVRKP